LSKNFRQAVDDSDVERLLDLAEALAASSGERESPSMLL